MRFKLSTLLPSVFCLLFSVYTIYSYAFLDVGLTLTAIKPFLDFQKKMRYFGNFNRPASTVIFILLSFLLFAVYYFLFTVFKKEKISLKKILLLTVFISGILIPAYPAFSHDIFNYIFNAKMVLIFKVDPHKHVALEFIDPMLSFMRNVHTPAPYFYGWTAVSLIPFILGLNRIFPEIISFKFFSVLLFFLTFIFLKKILKKLKIQQTDQRLFLFLLNPFILIEAVGVGHNDLAMMLPALLSFYFLLKYKQRKKLKFVLFSVFCFLFSVSTKYATVVLLPLFILFFYKDDFDIGLWGAIALFLVPFSRPLDQLHSWYLIWPLIWVFLAKNLKVVSFFCFLSLFALVRYVPYIWYGNWDEPVPFLRLLIYFLIPGMFLFLKWFKDRLIDFKFFFKSAR